MTYRNRISKPNRHDNLPHWANKRKNNDFEFFAKWFGPTGHKLSYSKIYKCEKINPLTGKYNGWSDVGQALRHLKKHHRQYNKNLIAHGIQDYEDDNYDEEYQEEFQEYLDYYSYEDFLEEEYLRDMEEYERIKQENYMMEEFGSPYYSDEYYY